jgi:hypothetical protein
LVTVTYHGLGEHGRLGNQLFQIAATVGIAHGLDEPVAFDPDWPYRPFFSLPDDWFADNWMDKTEASSYATHLPSRWRKYLQDPRLFADVADKIRAAFAPSARARAVLDALPQPGPLDVAVHVRRTDYEGRDGYLDMLPACWYRKATHPFSVLLGWQSRPDLGFHVYGDDPEWAQAELIPPNRREMFDPTWEVRGYGTEDGEPTDWCDLLMMARYRHHIIANSSYSWWAAWLSGDDHAVCPDPWFGPKIDVPSPALPHWPKVPV